MSKKRGQGEGSIYKRKDGLWVGQVTIQGRKVYKYSRLQREVREWLRETKSQVINGLTFEATKISLERFLSEWLVTHESSIRPQTFNQYKQIVRTHINPYLGNIKLKELRPDQIQSFYNAKLKSGTSERQVQIIHSVLHRALKQALLWGILGRNPTDAVTRPKYKPREMQVLNEDEVHIFLSASSNSRYSALYWLAVSTGLRQSELLGLKWSDIDIQNKTLKVHRQLVRLKNRFVFSEPKTKASRRVILLGDTTIDKLFLHKKQLEKEREIAGGKWKEMDLVFPTPVGNPTYQKNIYNQYKKIQKDANLPDIRFHDLRHTAATLMLRQGIHVKVVQETLGHSNVSVTMNIYSHVLPTMQKDAVDKMDNFLSAGSVAVK